MYLTPLNRRIKAPVRGKNRTWLHQYTLQWGVGLFWDWVCEGLDSAQHLCPGVPALAVSQGPPGTGGRGRLEPTGVDLIKIRFEGQAPARQSPNTSAERL